VYKLFLIINKLHKQIHTYSGKEYHFEPFYYNITFISSWYSTFIIAE